MLDVNRFVVEDVWEGGHCDNTRLVPLQAAAAMEATVRTCFSAATHAGASACTRLAYARGVNYKARQCTLRCHVASQLVAAQVQGTEEHAEQYDADMAHRRRIALPNERKLAEALGFLIDALNGSRRRCWIVRGYVLEDIFEPPMRLGRLSYLCHDRMRRAISSLERTRPAYESTRPRSAMT